VGAVNKLLKDRLDGGRRGPVEINEAFAVVPMAAMTELKIPHDIASTSRRCLRWATDRCQWCPHHHVDLCAEGNQQNIHATYRRW
jgi:hypothetical protein